MSDANDQKSSGNVIVGTGTAQLRLIMGTGQGVVTQFPKGLLNIATSLVADSYFNIAIVTACMACELATERALEREFTAKRLADLGEAVCELMNGYNLGNERNRNVFNALTGRQIQDESFWSRFKAATIKRNRIVHGGEMATKIEAEQAIQAADDLIAYLGV